MSIRIFGSKQHPTGPSLNKDYPIYTADLSGTQIEFQVPKHTDSTIPYKERPRKFNLYTIEREVLESGATATEFVFSSSWEFDGFPVIERRIGVLRLTIGILRLSETESLFKPSALEKAILREEYLTYGPQQDYGCSRCCYQWQTFESDENSWVTFWHDWGKGDSDADFSKVTEAQKMYFTTISDEHILYLSFKLNIKLENTQVYPEMLKLIEKIMASFSMSLSEDAQRQQQAAKDKWPEDKFSDYVPPFKGFDDWEI